MRDFIKTKDRINIIKKRSKKFHFLIRINKFGSIFTFLSIMMTTSNIL